MKRIIIFAPILFFLTLFVFNAGTVFASSCQQIGNTTFCDDGTSYQQIGNTTFGSDGTSYQRIGNTTFGSDGSNYQRIGNTTFGSDGTSYQRIGNTTFGSDGTSYQRIGNTTFGSGGGNVYNSCPANSSYDSSTGNCTCFYGYKSDGINCVYDYSYTPPTPAPIYTPKTNDQICQGSYGLNANWNGTKASNGDLNCICKTNYVWNSKGTACVINKEAISRTNLEPEKKLKWYQKIFNWVF